jgi:pyruvate dehydrogenase E2 component (dihydrolipoamide acetyltransferase)
VTPPAGARPRATTHYVDVAGTRLHVRRTETAESAEPPLLLLHGLGGDSTSWTLNQKALAADRPVVAVDLPGHGRSDPAEGDGTVPSTAALLSGLPDALGLDRFHLVGLSYGGALALDIAERIEERILSLTCVSSTGLGREVNIDFILGYLDADTPEAMRASLALLYHNTRKINDTMVGYALLGRADADYRAGVRRITDANFENGASTTATRSSVSPSRCTSSGAARTGSFPSTTPPPCRPTSASKSSTTPGTCRTRKRRKRSTR